MAAPISPICSPHDIREVISQEGPRLTFDVRNGGWVLSSKVCKQAMEIGGRELGNVATTALQGAAFGALGGIWQWFSTPKAGILETVGVFFGLVSSPPSVAAEVVAGVSAGAIRAARGAALGSGLRALKEVSYIVRFSESRIDEKLSEKMNRIMKALFELFAAGDRITCLLSRDIFHIPVKTNCTNYPSLPAHIFEYSQIKQKIEEGDSTCPFPDCEKEISLDQLTFATGKRAQVSDTVKRALTWLASQDTEGKSDDLTQEEIASQNEESIIREIRAESLSGKNLQFVSRLVKESVDRYNKHIDRVYLAISLKIAEDEKQLGIETSQGLRRCLDAWRSSSRIELRDRNA